MSETRISRRLAAIMAADLVGYSRMMGEDEAGTLQRFNALRLGTIEPRIAAFSGRIVKLMGDGLLVEFPSVVDALQCAVEIQDALRATADDLTDGPRMQLRIGVNLGDIIVEESDIFGDGVNIAARLEGLAEPGGICVSDSVKTAVDGKLSVAFDDMGEQQLKNIRLPLRVFRVLDPDDGDGLESPVRTTPALPEKPSIAVLAFNNMSGDPEQEYFSDGITEDIITELSRFSGLFVIARNSSFAYKGRTADVKVVARELGVRYLLEGSVRRAGSRLRINAQLLDTETAAHIWAEKYDGDLEDVFALQDEITRNIVGSIAPQIEIAEVERSRRFPAANLTSYELSLKAQALFYDSTRSSDPGIRKKTIEVAQAALDLDPENSHALWIQGYSHLMQYLYRWGDDPEKSLDLARDIAARFLRADSSNPRAYLVRAMIHTFSREFDAAIADYQRAFALNPNFALNAMIMAWGESLAGLTREAREHADLALRLSPRDLDLWLGDAYLAKLQACFAEGDFDEAKKWGLLAVQMTPNAPIRRALMIAICINTDDPEGAEHHGAELNTFSPDFIPSLLSGKVVLYKNPEHNRLLKEGLQQAGYS